MSGGGIDWRPWSREAFERAAASGSLVLLSITTTWSRGCARMMRETYADPLMIAAVGTHCVAVQVDADERPDVAERYLLDGWPTTLLLTPDGEILNGVTFATPATLIPLIERTAELYARDRAGVAARAEQARAARSAQPDEAEETPADLPRAVAAALMAQADESHGGFNEQPKFVHGDALLFLLRYGAATGDAAPIAHARRTAEQIVGGPMLDVERGISRCSGDRVWREPAREYEPATQAAVLRVFAAGCAAGFDASWRDAAMLVADTVARNWLPLAPQHQRYVDAAADLSGGLLACAAVLEDRELAGRALAALEQSVLSAYRPGRGLMHSSALNAPRLLLDHVVAIDALLDAREVTGEQPYAMLAEELGWFVLGHFAHATGAFQDRTPPDPGTREVGLLAEPWFPFRANALASRALARLSAASGERKFAEAGAAAFAWTAARWARQGLDAASCGIAALDLIDWHVPGLSQGHHTTR